MYWAKRSGSLVEVFDEMGVRESAHPVKSSAARRARISNPKPRWWAQAQYAS